MPTTLRFTATARMQLAELEEADKKKHRKVLKTLGYMETDLRHPGLRTHAYTSLKGPNDEKVFEAYVENNTPAAFRIFWYYGPDKEVITILAITPHP